MSHYPRPLDPERVEDGDSVSDMGLNRVRRPDLGRRDASLRVPDDLEEVAEKFRASGRVVVDRRPAVQEERRTTAPAPVTTEVPAVDRDREGGPHDLRL